MTVDHGGATSRRPCELRTRRTPEVDDLRGSSKALGPRGWRPLGPLIQTRATLPARMHEVHALIRRRLPGATSAFTDWMFGFQRRGVRRCECDTDIPKPGPLPHTSHTAATVDHSQRDEQNGGADGHPLEDQGRV